MDKYIEFKFLRIKLEVGKFNTQIHFNNFYAAWGTDLISHLKLVKKVYDSI